MFSDAKPWLLAAIFCEATRDDEESGGRPGLVRPTNAGRIAVNRATFSPDQPFVVPLYLALAGGQAGRQFEVKLVLRDPAGKVQREDDSYVVFPGVPGAVVDTIIEVPIRPTRSGVYWVDVLLDDDLLTRAPYRIELQYN